MTPTKSTAVQPGTSSQNSAPPDDFFVPAYRIKINQKDPPQLVEQDVLSVSYHDSLTDVESVDLVVNNWDPGDPVPGQEVQGRFRYHNEHVFDPWQEITLDMGYYRNGKDNLQPMLVGSICSMAPNFPASGGSTLTVRALGLLHQFRIEQTSLQFPNMTDTEIAKKIVDTINAAAQKKLKNIKIQLSDKDLKANKSNEKPNPYLEMHNQYPIVFLMQRAREIGYDISIDPPDTEADRKANTRTVTFRFGPSKLGQRPAYVLEWGKSLISFQPTLQTARQVNAVTVNGWDVHGKKPISVTVTRADLSSKVKAIAPEDLGMAENQLAQKIEVVVDRAYKSAEDAKNAGKAALLNLAKELVTGKGKTIGLPDLRAGSKVKICMNPLDVSRDDGNMVDRFSGLYEVTETTHTINESGYTTDFSCRLEAKKDK